MNLDIKDVIDQCIDSFVKSWVSNMEYYESIKAFKETCEANDYTFESNGSMRNV